MEVCFIIKQCSSKTRYLSNKEIIQQQIYSHSDLGTTSAFVVRAVLVSGTESNQFFTDGAQNCCFKLTCLNKADFKAFLHTARDTF
jgi:hypothetical protein